MAAQLTYEYPGILVLDDGKGNDVAIDRDGDDWRVYAYKGRWAYEDRDPEFIEGIEVKILQTEEAYAEGVDAVANRLGKTELKDEWGNPYLKLPGGVCVLVTTGHVFIYWCDDGGACVGIIHRIEDGNGECDDLNCTPDLVVVDGVVGGGE